MATVAVVNYSDSHKINVLQLTAANNGVNVDTAKREVIVYNKNTNILPASSKPLDSDSSSAAVNSSKRRIKAAKEMTRSQIPPPVAVARRNARERNRVKQVNNGFATLRQHIPASVASVFETGNSRSVNKKLSKVETLRMAVEYIRRLENVLTFASTDTNGIESNSPSSDYDFISSAAGEYANKISFMSSNTDEESSSNTSFSTGISSRVPITTYYQYETDDLYEDEENLQPSNLQIYHSSLLSDSFNNESIDLSASENAPFHNLLRNSVTLSPQEYSEQSLPPAATGYNEIHSFVHIIPNKNRVSSFKHVTLKKYPQLNNSSIETQSSITNGMDEITTVQIKDENSAEHGNEDMVSWWERNQRKS